MANVDPRALWAAYREANAIPATARARALQGISTRIRLGGVPAIDVDPPSLPNPALPWVVVGASVVVAAVAYAVTPTEAPTAVLGLAPAFDHPPRLPPPVERAAPASSVTHSPEQPTARDDAPPHKRPARGAHKAPAEKDDTLSAELLLVKIAKQRLRAGDPRGALAKVSEHARRFPNGALADAREVTRMEALCELGALGELERARTRFLSKHASSAHAARVRGLCKQEGGQ